MAVPAPPTRSMAAPPSYCWQRMLALVVIGILWGALLGYVMGLMRAVEGAVFDPLWWSTNGRFAVFLWILLGTLMGLPTAPVLAIFLWRKNPMIALPVLFGVAVAASVYLIGRSAAYMPLIYLAILECCLAVVLWLVLPNVVRRYRPGFCPNCSYDLHLSISDTCPECGVIIGSQPNGSRHVESSIEYRSRRPRIVWLAGAATILIGGLGVAVFRALCDLDCVTATYSKAPTASMPWPSVNTFVARWNIGWARGRTAISWGGASRQFCEADAVFFPANDGLDRMIEVLVPKPGAPAGAPAMQIKLSYLPQDSRSGVSSFPYPGDPYVICNLDGAQANFIWQNDVPNALIDAMIKAADDAGWEPMDPNVGRPFKPTIVVDSAPFFP